MAFYLAGGSILKISDDVRQRLQELGGPAATLASEICDALTTDDLARVYEIYMCAWSRSVSIEETKSIRQILNQDVLLQRSLEFTHHGVKRTFRFWSEDEKKRYLEFAHDVCRVLVKANITNVCVGYGGALAIGRSRDLIPHDDDLDLIVSLEVEAFPTIAAGIEHVRTILEAADLKVQGDYLSHRHVSNGQFCLDLFVGIEEDGFFSSYPGPRKYLRAETVFPPILHTLFNAPVLLPRALKSYLVVVYGKEWERPDPNFNHKWDKLAFSPLLPS